MKTRQGEHQPDALNTLRVPRPLPHARTIVRLCLVLLVLWISSIGTAAYAESVKLFGTVEIKRPLNAPPGWLAVMERNAQNSIFKPENKLNSSTTWGELKARLEKLSRMEQLRQVSLFWNKWPYRTSIEAYGKNYWAAPYEFLKLSGNCKEYSIAKFFTLRELGFLPDHMRIVVVMETIRNIAHAVLVVYLEGDAYVLDNLSNNAISHTRYRNYEPRYSVNDQSRWAHIKPKK